MLYTGVVVLSNSIKNVLLKLKVDGTDGYMGIGRIYAGKLT
jgi:hypothetical protein